MFVGTKERAMNSSPSHSRTLVLCLLTIAIVCVQASFSTAANSPYKIALASINGQYQGSIALVDVTLSSADTTRGLTGFDMTIAYDHSGLYFREVLPGTIITDCDWEYFSYEWGRNGDCHGDCPEGVVRIVGTANLSSCSSPIPGVGTLPKTLFTLKFLVTSDRTYECNTLPVSWYWMDCRDNILTSTNAGERIISQKVFNPGWSATNPPYEVTDSSYHYPTYLGAQKSCSQPATGTAVRLADFYHGYINTYCLDTYDARGDININRLPYEVADFALLRSYFLHGTSVFTVDSAFQIATSDVNADGLTLTVGDIVYEGLVIAGQAAPYRKPAGVNSPWDVRLYPVGDTLYVETGHTVGGLFLIFDGDVHPTLLQPDAGINYEFDGTKTRTLILGDSVLTVARVVSGPLLTFPNLVVPDSAQAADTIGMVLPVIIDSPTDVGDHQGNGLPAAFSLDQNYPNPFNPTTTISFSLPRATSYTLTIYNMAGQEVTSFTGTSGPGVVRIDWDGSGSPSGVYLYKLTTGTFSDTRKMLLIK